MKIKKQNIGVKEMKKIIALLLSVTMLLSVIVTGRFTLPTSAATSDENEVKLYQKEVELPGALSTNYYKAYSARTPKMVSFVDSKGSYNVAYPSENNLNIYRYNDELNLTSTLKIPFRLSLFGNVTFDEDGNLYVCWGENDTEELNAEVIRISKYNYNGALLSEFSLTGYEATPYSPGEDWGTKLPFDAGTCSMAINNGVLACNFAREMYSAHQSNFAFYVNCDTMERMGGYYPYVSHSFNQDCVATSDGGFLMANHGDSYPRSFVFSKIRPSLAMSSLWCRALCLPGKG
jgi:hypothetical protein